MLAHKVQITCGQEYHKIVLNERGQLHFENHESASELEAYNNLQHLGGQKCECATFLKTWRERKYDGLPEHFAAACRRSQGQKLATRYLRKLQGSKIRRSVWDPKDTEHYDNLPKVRKKSFVDAFLHALYVELTRRGHEVKKIFLSDKPKPGIYTVDECQIGLWCAFEPISNIAMTAKMESGESIKVVPHKNAIRGLLMAAEAIELRLTQHLVNTAQEADKKRAEQWRDYLAVLRADRNSSFNFKPDKVSGLLELEIRLHGLTGPAAQIVQRMLDPVLDKILKVSRNSLARKWREEEYYARKTLVQDASEAALRCHPATSGNPEQGRP